MSTTSINTSGGLTSTSTLTNTGANGQLQITGLASGLNTDEIIQAEMAEQELPLTNLQNQITGLNTENTTLSSVQTSLQSVSLDALMLGEPSLYFNVQTISSSDPSLVTAQTSDGAGAPIGSSTITVSQLASAAQAAFNFTSPTSGTDTLTISDGVSGDGSQTVQVAAGATVQGLADQVNGDDTLNVWAAVSSTGQLVLSSRNTGSQYQISATDSTNPANLQQASTYSFASPSSSQQITVDGQTLTVAAGTTASQLAGQINGVATDVTASVNAHNQLVLASTDGASTQVTDPSTGQTPAGFIEVSGAQAGQDAQYTINGVAGTSATDTVTGAIPGVTLALQGVTGTGSPVTVTAQAPGPDTQSILNAVNQFVQDYNSTTQSIQSAVNTAPSSESDPSSYNPYSGSLYGDPELEDLLSSMRQTMYTPGAGLPAGMAALSDIGISTGASTGTVSQSSLSGQLTVDTAQLTQAIETNPTGVKQILTQWSQSFQSLVNGEASPGGAISSRIDGDNDLISNVQSQLTTAQQVYQQQETAMQAEWAQVEATLSQLHTQNTYLSSIPTSSSSSSSSSAG